MTLYRLTRNCLCILAGVSIIEAFFGWLPFTALELVLSLAVLLFTARVSNSVFALFTHTAPTTESPYITALILFFILTPLQSATDALVFMVVATLAMISKYVLAKGKVHFFNPALLAVFIVSFTNPNSISWWVGNILLLPAVTILGFLVVRKMKVGKMCWYFVVSASLFFMLKEFFFEHVSISGIAPLLIQFVTATPLLFFAAFVLTDPQTMSRQRKLQKIGASIVGVLYQFAYISPLALGFFVCTPEFAGMVGNVVTAITGKRKHAVLSLHAVTQLSKSVCEYTFLLPAEESSSFSIKFKPGQYIEWSLPHKADARGHRRSFWISSAPTEHFVKFVTSIPTESSTFKDMLVALKKGEKILALGVHGESLLPKDPNQKVLLVVEGLGIAPVMSAIRALALEGERRDMVLVYSARTPLDFIYKDEIDEVKDAIGLRVIYVPLDFTELSGWEGFSGKITPEFIRKNVPDFTRRHTLTVRPDQIVIAN